MHVIPKVVPQHPQTELSPINWANFDHFSPCPVKRRTVPGEAFFSSIGNGTDTHHANGVDLPRYNILYDFRWCPVAEQTQARFWGLPKVWVPQAPIGVPIDFRKVESPEKRRSKVESPPMSLCKTGTAGPATFSPFWVYLCKYYPLLN